MTDPWPDRLSDYLDGTLDADAREALEAHLPACTTCRDLLDGLRQVVDHARRLEDRQPDADLWPGIAARIGVEAGAGAISTAARGSSAVPRRVARRGAPRRFSFTLPQLAAAGITLAVLSGGTVWLAQGTGVMRPDARERAARAATATALPPTAPVAAALDAGEPAYASAVRDLERVLAERRDRLDPATARVLEENLRIIDQAIRDAQRALAADPSNAYLNQHLAGTMRRKLNLLRRAATIVRAQT